MLNNKAANRLINEKSPYLLQHAYNPVNWYPWTEEAFIKAKEEDKPIFLSIGYSTCHWCHVMERESFEDEDVAKVLNEDYICIKVDREERPDVDSIYMSYCQAITGRGGWPLTIIMTPDKKPFFAGTYFPKESKYGKPGIIEILKAVTLQWRNKREQVLSYSSNLLTEIKKTFVGEDKEELNEEILINTFEGLTKAFDNRYGGFYNAPKFPTPHKLMYLLRMWKVYGYKEALHMFEKTLDGMYKGGMFDHIGFGFSRYSTDKMWLAPHFEKMLYDNALLALVYAEAYAETKNAKYKDVCEKIFWYLEDKMISREGGLYSAEDADSEGVEGKFYLWTPKEVKEILGEEDGAYFCNYFDITEKGNFEGKNIANLIKKSIEEMEEKDLKKLNSLREKLYSYREKRVHPHKDDKILTSWNGLAIVAFAYAGRVFHNKYYIELGEKALDFVLKNLTREDGRLLARYRDGEAAYLAYLDDYAFLTWGLLELYEATFKGIYLEKATHFNKKMIDLYWDDEDSGFYIYGKDGEELLMRPKESFDNAIPSGNSIGINNMLRLSNINEDMELKEKAESALKTFSYNIKHYPEAHLFMLINLMYAIKGNNKIVLEGKLGEEALNSMIKEINNRFTPFTDIKLEEKEEKRTTAYVCKNFTCSSPVSTIEDFVKLI